MARRFAAALAASCALFVLGAGPLAAERTQVHKVEDALDVLTAMTAIPEHEAFQQLIRKTYALAIFPDVQKVSIIIGGQRGKGVLIVRDGKGHWTRPLFLSLSGASVGWQIGVQSADIVLFFRTRSRI